MQYLASSDFALKNIFTYWSTCIISSRFQIKPFSLTACYFGANIFWVKSGIVFNQIFTQFFVFSHLFMEVFWISFFIWHKISHVYFVYGTIFCLQSDRFCLLTSKWCHWNSPLIDQSLISRLPSSWKREEMKIIITKMSGYLWNFVHR